MPYAVGIDLGTTNCTVSVFRRGVVETLPVEGKTTMPSVVSFRDGGDVLVGQAAKARTLLDPEHTVASAKRFMGDREKTYQVSGRNLTPVDVASIVLKRIVENASKTLGEDVSDAVITVPAYFTEAQREDTKHAGEKAGLNVLRLVPEPTAAAIAYGMDKGKDQLIMIYDLGGGTFDISILAVKGNVFTVKAVGGDSRLGGDDFDEAVITWAAKQFKAQSGIDLAGDTSREGMKARQLLKEAAETAKIELSQSSRTNVIIPNCLGHSLDLELSVTEFNALCEPLLARTVNHMKSVLADAGLKPADIDRVILVGGATKTPAVREIVAREIKEPYVADRVDEVVSHGAALVAANFYLPEEDMLPIEVVDVTGHSLGIDVLNEKHEVTFVPVIPRQTKYPCRRGFMGATSRPMQDEVLMQVFRGEDVNPEKNAYLGELSLPVSPPRVDFVPIGSIFELDADGIIHFTAVQLPIGSASATLIDHAMKHNNELDLPVVDRLISSGKAKVRTVAIKT